MSHRFSILLGLLFTVAMFPFYPAHAGGRKSAEPVTVDFACGVRLRSSPENRDDFGLDYLNRMVIEKGPVIALVSGHKVNLSLVRLLQAGYWPHIPIVAGWYLKPLIKFMSIETLAALSFILEGLRPSQPLHLGQKDFFAHLTFGLNGNGHEIQNEIAKRISRMEVGDDLVEAPFAIIWAFALSHGYRPKPLVSDRLHPSDYTAMTQTNLRLPSVLTERYYNEDPVKAPYLILTSLANGDIVKSGDKGVRASREVHEGHTVIQIHF